MILQHTCIRAGDDDDLSGQIRDVLQIEPALRWERLFENRSNNAHRFCLGRVMEKEGNVTWETNAALTTFSRDDLDHGGNQELSFSKAAGPRKAQTSRKSPREHKSIW